MLKPNAERLPFSRAVPLANGQAYRLITGIPNGHLHIALAAALVAVTLIALVIPIARRGGPSAQPAAAANSPAIAGGALSLALQSQAEAIAGALASPASAQMAAAGLNLPLHATGGSALVPQPLVAAAARIVARGVLGAPEPQSALTVRRASPVGFTLNENGFSSVLTSSQLTVGQALAEVGVRVGPNDAVTPAADSELTPGQHIFVRYASQVRFVLAGQEQTAYTRADTVGGMLAAAGVGVQPTDLVYPDLTTPVTNGMSVSVITVRDVEMPEDTPIEFDTVYQDDPDVARGNSVLVQAGSQGNVHRVYKVRQVNGHEAKRELVAESTTPATTQVLSVGTYVAPVVHAPAAVAAAPAGAGDCATSMRVWATWYTSASAGGSTTATGTGVYKGIVAVDPWVIPLGTRMYVPGYGYAIAADTGGGVRGNMIDLAYGDSDAYDWGSRWVDICILS